MLELFIKTALGWILRRVHLRVSDRAVLHEHYVVEDFLGDYKERPKDVKPIKVLEFEKNVFLNEGINELWALVCGTGATKFDNANANFGVGDSDAAEVATQTGLQGTNKTYKGMDATYPIYGSDQKAIFRSTFGAAEANHAWKEFTIANGNSDSAKNLNRKVQDMGTKTNAVSRVITAELSIA